jgi:hypothetical protein
MPNDCWNSFTFVSDDSVQLRQLFDNEILSMKMPKEYLEVLFKGKNGITLKLWSAWRPDFVWFTYMVDKYSKCWIKNEWIDENGFSGVIVGGFISGKKVDTTMCTWQGLCIEDQMDCLEDNEHKIKVRD